MRCGTKSTSHENILTALYEMLQKISQPMKVSEVVVSQWNKRDMKNEIPSWQLIVWM